MKIKDTQRAALQSTPECEMEPPDPQVEALVTELIGRVADKWTMMIIEVLTERGELRFTRLSEMVPGISYKMLTQTLRHMEREGLLIRTVHPVVPPKVEYRLTGKGRSFVPVISAIRNWGTRNLIDATDELEETAK